MQLLVKDTAFDTTNTREYDLSIRISADGFSFCIYHVASKTFVHWKHLAFPLQDTQYYRCQAIALCEPYFEYEFNRVFVVFSDTANTIIPEGIFNATDYNLIFSYNFPEISNSTHDILSNSLAVFSLTNLFAITKEQHTFWKELFPNVTCTHFQTPLIDALLRESKKENRQEVWVQIQKKNIFLVYAEKGKLIFSNTFPIQSATDIVYLCGNVYEQFGLSQHTTKLVVLGSEATNNEPYSLLSTHFANIHLHHPPTEMSYHSSFNTPDIQSISDLLALPLCV
jgi:hypothetical protein